MNNKDIKSYLDEDYFARKQMGLSDEKRREISRRWFELHFFVERNLLKTGKISKITYRRWDRVLWKKYGYMRHEFMMPSEFNKRYGIKPTNMKFFKNAENKIKIELSKLKEDAVESLQEK